MVLTSLRDTTPPPPLPWMRGREGLEQASPRVAQVRITQICPPPTEAGIPWGRLEVRRLSARLGLLLPPPVRIVSTFCRDASTVGDDVGTGDVQVLREWDCPKDPWGRGSSPAQVASVGHPWAVQHLTLAPCRGSHSLLP